MAALSLVFDLIGRDVSASKAFKDVGDAADRAGKKGEESGGLISKGMKLAGGALLGAGLIEGFKSLYEQAAESAKIGRLTTQVIQTTGGAAGVTAKQVSSLATAISNKTGVDDEAIQSGENLLLTFTNVRNEVGKGNDIFNRATGIITDMSVALGQDTSTSAIQLGKALNDPIKGVSALQRVGVSFTESQKEQIKTLVASGNQMEAQKLILGELSKEFGGAAAAAATPFQKLQVHLGNLAEELGSYLIPAVDTFANFLDDHILPAATKLGTFVGGALNPALHLTSGVLGAVLDIGNGVVRFFDSLPGPLQATVVAMGALAVLKGPLSSFFGTLKDIGEGVALKMLYARDAISSVGAAGGAAKAGLGGLMSFFGGPWGLAVTGATLGLSALVSWLGKSSQASKEAADYERDLASALKDSKGAIDDNVRALAAKRAEDSGLLEAAQKAGVALPVVTSALLGNRDAYNEVRSALVGYAADHRGVAGVAAAAKAAHDDEGKAALGARDTLDALSGSMTQAEAASSRVASASKDVTGALGGATASADEYQKELEDTAKASDDAKKQTDMFKLSLDILTGQHVSLIQVQATLQEALAEGTGAMKDLTGSVLDASGGLNVQSESGRKAQGVLLDVRDAGNQLISTMISQGATSDQVKAQDAQLRDSFIRTANQMGITGQNAINLANQILGIPDQRNTTITADTGPARGQLDALIRDYSASPINVGVSLRTGRQAAATGGFIAGPGTGKSDSIPAMLSNGEFVINAASTARYRPLLEAINGGGRPRMVPGFASGGMVDFMRWMQMSSGVDPASAAAIKSQIAAFSSFSSAGGNAGNRSLGQQIAAAMGFGGQFSAIDYVFSHESGWNNMAQNPTSTAFGIPQFLNSTWAAYGGKTTDPARQIGDGIRYMVDRYGSPSGAASFWQRNHWYDNGGWLQPGYTLAANGTGKPERVRTAEQEAALQQQLAGGNVAVYAQFGEETIEARAVRVVTEYADAGFHRGQYNG